MAEVLSIRPKRNLAPGDRYSDELDASLGDEPEESPEQIKKQANHKELRRLLEWYYMERDRQADNRLEMAMDHDFYDNLQWDPEDAAVLKDRGQMPLVYNEVAPMVDWLIGTERRTKVDWRVMPRTEDDVQQADIKTKVLKYISDINRTQFARSRAFADAIKGGVGWVDDGARNDPTQDILYSKYEDWRNVLWDSQSYELDLSDARYLFRWRWVDEDVALAALPGNEAAIRKACEDQDSAWFDEDGAESWYMGERVDSSGRVLSGGLLSSIMLNTRRRRVKLIECQYRKPTKVRIVDQGPMRGMYVPEGDVAMERAIQDTSMIIERVAMRVHIAVFTESELLSVKESPYRHNRFSLTPIWCYRRSRDRLPYGVIRRVRDIQQDLNKRASKALFMLNTNQVIADEGAVADPNKARHEVDSPDGWIEKRAGKEFIIRRDTDAATGQVQMMTLAAQSIQKTAGVNNENLGRQTNAVSGAAIQARQNQGSVGTTEPFDNLRYAVQVQGEKQLSMAEQFYTEAKVVRLTQEKGQIEWVKINTPEQQPDGSVRILNDITSSAADFVVSEADYAGTLRQVMFDAINQLVMRLPPEIGLRLFTLAMEFSDLPNKDAIVQSIRQMTGEPDPNKEPTAEEAMLAEQQAQLQAEAMQMQREQAMLALDEQRAKVREINAKAAEIEARSSGSQDGMPPEIEQAINQIRSQAADQIDALSAQLAKAQSDLSNRTAQIGREADSKIEVARIEADSKVRVAEIAKASDQAIAVLSRKLDDLSTLVDDVIQAVDQRKSGGEDEEKPNAPAAAPAPAIPPMTINVQVDATKDVAVKKAIDFTYDKDGRITGGVVSADMKGNEPGEQDEDHS